MQITAFLAHSNARVASLAGGSSAKGGGAGGADGGASDGGGAGGADDDEAMRRKAQKAYEGLKAFHDKKGWNNARNG